MSKAPRKVGASVQPVAAAPKSRGNAGKGRPKGVPNKATATAKQMLQGVIDELGHAWLLREAKKHPTAFFALISKLVPTAIEAEVKGNITYRLIDGVPDANLGD
jgi:hypothetical protein